MTSTQTHTPTDGHKCVKWLCDATNTMFRILLNEDRFISASGLFVKHNVPNMDVLVRRLTFSLYSRDLQSDNPLVQGITN